MDLKHLTKQQKNIVVAVVIVVAVIILGAIACFGIFRKFSAKDYVRAVLDQTFQGEVGGMLHMAKESDEKTLENQYEEGVRSFVKNTIMGGASADADTEEKYVELGKKIFDSVKYQVKDSKKGKDGTFKVTVAYEPTDVFAQFVKSASEEMSLLNEKVEKGEYRGSLEEINAQMQADYLKNLCGRLEDSYKNMKFGKEQTMEFTVSKGVNGLYRLGEGEIATFITKIMGLDEIGD